MKCKNCGKEIGNDMLFCPYCGTKQDLVNSQDVAEKKVRKTVKSKNNSQGNGTSTNKNRNISTLTASIGEDDNIIKEFAIKVLKYMRRSRSERQIVIYTNKCYQTIQYCKQNNIDSDFEPYIFAEALRKLEEEKKTTIYHIEADELAKCIAENKDEFVMRTEQSEQAPKKESSSSIGKIFGWGIIIVLFLMLKMCGGCNGCGSYGDVRSESISELKQIIRESGTITEDEAKCLVVHLILNNMKDPNSYEPVSWGPLNKTQEIDGEGGGWNIKHKYRGTNSFGATVTEEHIFIIHKDGWVTSL